MLWPLFLTNLLAEYRVYQYFIKTPNPYQVDQQSYMVVSTLDPHSYRAYHGQEVRVDLLRTWKCYGYTGQKRPCPAPLESRDQQGETQ